MRKNLLILLFIGLIVSACAPESPTLVGAWTLTAFGTEGTLTPAVTESGAGLTFNEDGTVTGSSGCNGIGGDYTVNGNEIEFGQFVSTLMACEDPIMTQEGAMMQVVNGAVTYEVEGDTLTLKNGDRVLVFSTTAE